MWQKITFNLDCAQADSVSIKWKSKYCGATAKIFQPPNINGQRSYKTEVMKQFELKVLSICMWKAFRLTMAIATLLSQTKSRGRLYRKCGTLVKKIPQWKMGVVSKEIYNAEVTKFREKDTSVSRNPGEYLAELLNEVLCRGKKNRQGIRPLHSAAKLKAHFRNQKFCLICWKNGAEEGDYKLMVKSVWKHKQSHQRSRQNSQSLFRSEGSWRQIKW